jgi:hypothetical protein
VIERVFKVDGRAEGAKQVADELRLDVIPSQFAAIYSDAIEMQIVESELAYDRNRGGKRQGTIAAAGRLSGQGAAVAVDMTCTSEVNGEWRAVVNSK